MEATIVDFNYLYSLDYENKLCIDCKTSMPQYVSINNGVIICHDCSIKHKALGYNISYVREIGNEWDPYLLAFLLRGGNGRFIRLTRDYNIESLAIEYKYITKATEYYRLLIKSEVYAEEPPEPLLKNKGIEYCNMNANYFPEFENYEIYEGKKQPAFTEKFYNSFKTVGNGLNFIYKTLSQSDIKDKVISGSSLTYNVLKVAGGFIFQTSKPLVNFVSKKATEGMGYIYHRMKENFIEEGDKEDPLEITAKNKNRGKSLSKAKKSTRPRSIGKESVRKSFIGNTKMRSTSMGKDEMKTEDFNDNKKYFFDKQNITNSISLIDEKEEFYFLPVNDYPTYEEIMKHHQTNLSNIYNSNINSSHNNYHDPNNNINQPYQDINEYKINK